MLEGRTSAYDFGEEHNSSPNRHSLENRWANLRMADEMGRGFVPFLGQVRTRGPKRGLKGLGCGELPKLTNQDILP